MDTLAELRDDGHFAHRAGPWVLDKLAILACYLREFAIASRAARRWYYVDGFAGPGVHLVGERRWVPGSALVALRTEPEYRRCVLLEEHRVAVEALEARTAPFGDRAVVERRNANDDLADLVYTHVSLTQPCLCLFDPEDAELQWSTVTAVADLKRGRPAKIEQLIVFPTDAGFLHDLPTADLPPEFDPRRIFGNDRWVDVYVRRRKGVISPEEARTAYVKLYAQGLKDLGYHRVQARQISRRGRPGRPLYFLLYATDGEAGARNLDGCFESVFGTGGS